jgi:hypothetical protein
MLSHDVEQLCDICCQLVWKLPDLFPKDQYGHATVSEETVEVVVQCLTAVLKPVNLGLAPV